MNRRLAAVAAAGALFLSRPASAQVALVVGSVRDESGAPVAGATVTGSSASGMQSTTTAADGTFALTGERIAAVTIACRYCARSTFPIAPGEPVVAIVRRYHALLDASPSPEDLRSLPYGRVESSLSLRPFTLLRQTSTFFPGAALSDRGLQPENALVIDAGVPDYDVAFGASPYANVPAHYESSADLLPAADAFLYGDQAGSGIARLDPFSGTGDGVALYGSDAMARVESASANADVVAGSSSNWQESRQRADGELRVPLSSAQQLRFGAGTAQSYQYIPQEYRAANNFSFSDAAFDDVQPTVHVYGSAVYDRGDYTTHYDALPIGDVWSDAQVAAGARTSGAVQFFADASDRLSTGIYDAQALGEARIAGTLSQNRLDAGVSTKNALYDVTAGVGLFGFSYTGGSGGSSAPSSGRLATPSLRLTVFPDSRWNATVEAADSFDLPNLWEQYAYGYDYGTLKYDRASLYAGQLSYTDLSRVSVSYEAAWQEVHGLNNGQITSSGIALTWQVAPLLALRSWTMVSSDATTPSGQVPSRPDGVQPSVGDVWLTYGNRNALRADAIYRKDFLNGVPFYHVDGDVSGPVAGSVRWYVGVEDRLRTTHVDAGLQIGR